MDKLLTMEANELDLVLQYPRATHQTVRGARAARAPRAASLPTCTHNDCRCLTRGRPLQVGRLLEVYHERGEAYLATCPVPLLSWEDMQAAKADALALPPGAAPRPACSLPAPGSQGMTPVHDDEGGSGSEVGSVDVDEVD